MRVAQGGLCRERGYTGKMSRCEKIQVALRLKPSDGEEAVWSWSSQSIYLSDSQRQYLLDCKLLTSSTVTSFHFDHCFSPDTSNLAVYQSLVHRIIQGCKFGFSGSVLAYGQTGSGKSYLMSGGETGHGLVHYALQDLVTDLREGHLSCSLFELYNEQIYDLFDPQTTHLKVKEDPVKGFFVPNLTEISIRSIEDITKMMEICEGRRHYAATKLNHHSSRAHCILKVGIRNSERVDGRWKVANSTLHLVDLAGSERLSMVKEPCEDLAQESRHINRSLFYLCQVITRLSDSGPLSHIPYRNSALTKILRSALGGTARTAIVCTAVPTSSHFDMTLSTLRFGAKARCIDNQVVADTYEQTCEGDPVILELERLRVELSTVYSSLNKSVSLDISPSVLSTSLPSSPLPAPVKVSQSTSTDLPDTRLLSLQTALQTSQSHLHSLTTTLHSVQSQYQCTLNSFKSLSHRHVYLT